MALSILDHNLWFPPAHEATEDGLLAMGGDLSVERLLFAYREGIFPWYEGDLPLWWCPDPRFVLFPSQLRVSKSMHAVLRSDRFQFKTNTAFHSVIDGCRLARRDHEGTWITPEVAAAYTRLHHAGFAHSAEAWQDGKLAGGLYGVKLGKVFFGESMFSLVSNASKFAFVQYVQQLIQEGLMLIDCQVYTSHLESLGAEMISRSHFLSLLKTYIA